MRRDEISQRQRRPRAQGVCLPTLGEDHGLDNARIETSRNARIETSRNARIETSRNARIARSVFCLFAHWFRGFVVLRTPDLQAIALAQVQPECLDSRADV